MAWGLTKDLIADRKTADDLFNDILGEEVVTLATYDKIKEFMNDGN